MRLSNVVVGLDISIQKTWIFEVFLIMNQEIGTVVMIHQSSEKVYSVLISVLDYQMVVDGGRIRGGLLMVGDTGDVVMEKDGHVFIRHQHLPEVKKPDFG